MSLFVINKFNLSSCKGFPIPSNSQCRRETALSPSSASCRQKNSHGHQTLNRSKQQIKTISNKSLRVSALMIAFFSDSWTRKSIKKHMCFLIDSTSQHSSVLHLCCSCKHLLRLQCRLHCGWLSGDRFGFEGWPRAAAWRRGVVTCSCCMPLPHKNEPIGRKALPAVFRENKTCASFDCPVVDMFDMSAQFC